MNKMLRVAVCGWDLSTASYDSVSLDVSSEDATPTDVAFKPDGTKMYVVGFSNKSIHQYTLSTGWDLDTASYDSISFSVSSQGSSPMGVAFKPNGTKMYVIGNSSDAVHQYTLSTGWDLSTASYDSISFYLQSEDDSPSSVAFKPNGTKMYVVGKISDAIHQYTLSTAWDLSTASYDSISFSVSSQEADPTDVAFKPNGTKMYVIGNSDWVHQYTLSTGWDLDTASYDSVRFDVASQDSSPWGVAFKPDGTKMYFVGISSDSVYQYSLVC